MKTILFVIAHPHYAANYAAGTIANLVANGDKVHALSLTYGELMTNNIPKDQLKKINRDEANKAGKLLGMEEINILDFNDTDITNRREIQRAIGDEIRRIKPDIVVSHNPKDTHPDFSETAKAVQDAIFFSILGEGEWCEKYPEPHMVKELFGFEVPMMSVEFKDDLHIDITDVIDLKIEAMKCFDAHIVNTCQSSTEKWVTAVTAPNRKWGMECGVMYTEAYQRYKTHEIHSVAKKTF